eukprot:TRINITY_DN6241_c0_g1_i1.p1 TRINITY_DN6241_c0_g1~~TRINITY_DN6241_c0_g1_i1.p1  ORF type:complete len:443 (-),score=91.71 TRINITY_DN6241_c0_g1_i1:124-1452(-)
MKEAADEMKFHRFNEARTLNRLNDHTTGNIKILEELRDSLHSSIDEEIQVFKSKVKEDSETLTKSLQCLTLLKERAADIVEGNEELNAKMLDLLSNFNRNRAKLLGPTQEPSSDRDRDSFLRDKLQTVVFDKPQLIQTIKRAVEDFVSYNSENSQIETTRFGCPKIVHWFEWGKKKLNVYDIIANVTSTLELDIPFKIPSFSRSIIIPSGHIYLLGGEEPEYFPRKEVYMFDLNLGDRRLHQKASMLHKKFDFTLCYLQEHIYVICGKDSSSEVIDSCERYNVVDNTWSQIAPVKRKRYAASAVGTGNSRIFLFGGRTDVNNMMVNDIEEYSVATNTWEIITIKGLNVWEPVEVCACLQINEDQILIFGGSDARIKDSSATFVFDYKGYTFQRKGDLRKPQVFVTAPFLYGKYVFAIGNEYYMKHRNLHRYSILRDEWDIIF